MDLRHLAQPLHRDDNVDPWDMYVRPHFDKLVNLLKPSLFLSNLVARGLVSRSDRQRLNAEPTSESQVQMLLMEILPYHLPWWSTFEIFCDVLAGTERQRDVLQRYICPPGLRLKTGGAAVPRGEQDRTITERDIAQVSTRVGASWDRISSSLDPPLAHHEIRNIRDDLQPTNEEKMSAALRIWLNKYSDLATIGRLRHAMERQGERKAADDAGLGIVGHIRPLPAGEEPLPLQRGDREITLNDIMDVSERFASQWEKVVVKLNPPVGDEVIRNARENKYITAEGRMKEVLEKWHDQHSTNATMNRLMHAVHLVEELTCRPAERDQPPVVANPSSNDSGIKYPVEAQGGENSPMWPTASVYGRPIMPQFADIASHPYSYSGLPNTVSRPTVVTTETGGRISREDMQLVCEKYADHWEGIAKSLNPQVDDGVIRKVKENPFQKAPAQLYEVLNWWLDANGDAASQVQLKKALLEQGLSSPF